MIDGVLMTECCCEESSSDCTGDYLGTVTGAPTLAELEADYPDNTP